MDLSAASLLFGSEFHLLDHIAPLSEALQIPLFVSEEKEWEMARYYYPSLKVFYEPNLGENLGVLAKNYEALFQCKYWPPYLKALLKDLHKKEVQLVFCPHGQSDKGFFSPLLSSYAFQDFLLLYGKLHIAMLKELKIWPSVSQHAILGNYRLAYYLEKKEFYDDLVQKEIFSHFDPKKPLLLYAPTWNDADGATSFFTFAEKIFSELPSHWNLLIKVHPLLEERDPARFYPLLRLTERKKNSFLLSEFPPIYPILSRVDVFLGDFSSVGYDFLFFQRPMFFLPHPFLPMSRLQKCGKMLPINQNLFALMETQLQAHDARKQRHLYEYAFGKQVSLQDVRHRISYALTKKLPP